MTLTLNLPDELVAFLPSSESDFAKVISAGLRSQRDAKRGTVHHVSEVAETLANLPTPQEVLAMRPSDELVARTQELLDKSKVSRLSSEEQTEWDDIMQVEHLVRVAKARATIKLKTVEQGA